MNAGPIRKNRSASLPRAALALAAILALGFAAVRRAPAAQKAPASPLTFSASAEQSTFSQGQAILLQLRLTNHGSAPAIVDAGFALGRTIQVNLTGAGGQAVNWSAAFPEGTPRWESLAPGRSLTRMVCLNCAARDPFADPLAAVGSYTLRLEYSAGALATAVQGNFPQAVPFTAALAAAPLSLRLTPATVRFTAEPTHPSFAVGDPIEITFQLQNTGSQPLVAAYNLPIQNAVWLKVTDASGAPVAWTGRPRSSGLLFSSLAAGASISVTHTITPQNLFGTIAQGVDIRQPGTYTVHAVYELAQPLSLLQEYVGVLPALIVPGPIAAPPVQFAVGPAAAPTSAQPKQP